MVRSVRSRVRAVGRLLAVFSACSPLAAEPGPEAAAIRRAGEAYVEAWVANDRASVLATLADDAVLLPAHGRPAVVGKPAIEAFWWPPGPPATVEAFSSTVDEAGAEGGVGWSRGSFELTFTWQGRTTTQRGTFLMLFRREADGAWRITHRMWDDALR